MVLGYGAFSAVDTNGDALAGGEYEIIAVNAFYKLRIDQVPVAQAMSWMC